ncbi:MAG: hypothetical protein NZM29_02330 [Nitrospira sp.]|nr:hypothetical protein [Nitrospira sp.]
MSDGEKQSAPSLGATARQVLSLLAHRSSVDSHFRVEVLLRLLAPVATVLHRDPRNISYSDSGRQPSGIAAQIARLAGAVRHLTRELGNRFEEDFDLAAELYNLKSVYDDIGRARIALHLQPAALEILTREEERAIFVLIRESLQHRVRHARANRIVISIRRLGRKICLHILDNGERLDLGKEGRNWDIVRLLQHQARTLKGTIHVQDKRGECARITIEFLLEPMLTTV